jgi:hypothetical protein
VDSNSLWFKAHALSRGVGNPLPEKTLKPRTLTVGVLAVEAMIGPKYKRGCPSPHDSTATRTEEHTQTQRSGSQLLNSRYYRLAASWTNVRGIGDGRGMALATAAKFRPSCA